MYLSPHSTIIPVDPVSISYFCTKSCLSFAFTASAVILSFTLVYCFAKSNVVSSSLYSTKYIFTSFCMSFTLSLLASVRVNSCSWLKSIGAGSIFCIA